MLFLLGALASCNPFDAFAEQSAGPYCSATSSSIRFTPLCAEPAIPPDPSGALASITLDGRPTVATQPIGGCVG